MSLQSRLSTLITAIGADIKALQNTIDDRHNASTANQTIAGNADTYIVGSDIAIPQGKIKIGTKYRLKVEVVKTAAGAAAPAFNVRVGTAGSTADTSRAALTFDAQTGAIDEGVFEFDCAFRAAGASAVIQAIGTLVHRLVTTGLSVTAVFTKKLVTGGSFDATGASLKIGVSVNPGASASWTVTLVEASLVNLTP